MCCTCSKGVPCALSLLTPSGSLPASYSSLQLLHHHRTRRKQAGIQSVRCLQVFLPDWDVTQLCVVWQCSTAPIPTGSHPVIYQGNHSKPPCSTPPLSHLHCAGSWFWEVIRAADARELTVLLHRTGLDVLLNVKIKVENKN